MFTNLLRHQVICVILRSIGGVAQLVEPRTLNPSRILTSRVLRRGFEPRRCHHVPSRCGLIAATAPRGSMQVKVTLSRLLKLQERLKLRIKELNDEATTAIGQTKNWRVSPTEDALTRVREGASKGIAAAREAIRLTEEFSKVRAVVSSQNEVLGISARMARIDGLTTQKNSLKSALAAAQGNTSIHELPAGSPVGDYGVNTGVMTDDDIQVVNKLVEDLQRDIYRLSDENAEANATRVEVDLADDVAALITA